MLASQVLARAYDTLQDSGVRWQEAEMLRYLNDAQAEAVGLKPSAYSETRVLQLQPGTYQQLPSDALMLMDVICNMGVTGAVPGEAVELMERGVLDSQRPDWHAETPSASVQGYMHELRDPMAFYVYPPQPDPAGQLRAVVSVQPPAVVSTGQELALENRYLGALTDYVLYRAYLKDTDHSSTLQRAALHYQAFGQSLGVTLQMAKSFSPRAPSHDVRSTIQQPPVN